ATLRAADELVCAAVLPKPTGLAVFDEISPRFAAPALASLALVVTATGLRVAVGGVTGKPTLLAETAARIGNGAAFGEIAATMREEMSDKVVAADSQYHLHLVETLLGRAVARYRKEASDDRH